MLTFLVVSSMSAVPAYPFPITIHQPDGTTLTVRLRGDEYYHYHVTEDGYPIVRNEQGVFNYAQVDASSGAWIDTRVKAHDRSVRTMSERQFAADLQLINPEVNAIQHQMRARRAPSAVPSTVLQKKPFPTIGSPRTLVILVNFTDLSFVTPNPQQAFSEMLNQKGYSANGGTGSAKDYFEASSNGLFSPQFDVVGPYALPQSYKYYGENKGVVGISDARPGQMIVDACKAAYDAGVDFALYDVNNDSIVDNVFVFYAGHNEAEGADKSTVWPHRWEINGYSYSGTPASATFNRRRVLDYACTSELRGANGANMAGIATFAHEFGHVLGLVDMYPTNDAKHHTLSFWSIMDNGTYLNYGRTPPTYNAFERFQLGYLTPVLLNDAADATLLPLSTSNQAYLISSKDTHNLNQYAPTPSEFFLLENRQKVGWDSYLPGHGMLIYRINYNAADWANNAPNNEYDRMGVDIVEADNKDNVISLSGDPFPGTTGVTGYTPTLRDKTPLTDKQITDIVEMSGEITFRFRGGTNAPQINTSTHALPMLNTTQGLAVESDPIVVSGKKLTSDVTLSFADNTHFEMKMASEPETAWRKTITLSSTGGTLSAVAIIIRYNPTEPSYAQTHQTALRISSLGAQTILVGLSGRSPRPVYVVPTTAYAATDITYHSFVASWEPIDDATGYYLTVFQIYAGQRMAVISNQWVTTTSHTVYNLISDREYTYQVKVSDKDTQGRYENITDYSNEIRLRTQPYPANNDLRVVPMGSGTVNVFVPTAGMDTSKYINVFDSKGVRIRSVEANQDIVSITELPKHVMLIFQLDNYRRKVILME